MGRRAAGALNQVKTSRAGMLRSISSDDMSYVICYPRANALFRDSAPGTSPAGAAIPREIFAYGASLYL